MSSRGFAATAALTWPLHSPHTFPLPLSLSVSLSVPLSSSLSGLFVVCDCPSLSVSELTVVAGAGRIVNRQSQGSSPTTDTQTKTLYFSTVYTLSLFLFFDSLHIHIYTHLIVLCYFHCVFLSL